MARSHRRLAPLLLPWWMYAGAGGKIVHAVASLVDVHVQKLREGLSARFPRRAGPSALALIGRYRLIPRGRSETDAHYAERLVAWRGRNGHLTRGGSFALLEQIWHYWGGLNTWTTDVNQNYRYRLANGTEGFVYGQTWEWDGFVSTEWGRLWVGVDLAGIATATPAYGSSELWGGSVESPSYPIGVAGVTREDFAAMRRLTRGPHRWIPAGVQAEWLIVTLDSSFLTADATYGRWSKVTTGTAVAARDADYRYVSFAPARNNVYGGSTASSRWANAVTLPGGSTESGDPATFPTSTTLPDGSTYAGDPASFPTSVQLPDDS